MESNFTQTVKHSLQQGEGAPHAIGSLFGKIFYTTSDCWCKGTRASVLLVTAGRCQSERDAAVASGLTAV